MVGYTPSQVHRREHCMFYLPLMAYISECATGGLLALAEPLQLSPLHQGFKVLLTCTKLNHSFHNINPGCEKKCYKFSLSKGLCTR